MLLVAKILPVKQMPAASPNYPPLATETAKRPSSKRAARKVKTTLQSKFQSSKKTQAYKRIRNQ